MSQQERKSCVAVYRCQFCEKDSPVEEWTANKDNCPKCGRAYDPILAQEMDD